MKRIKAKYVKATVFIVVLVVAIVAVAAWGKTPKLGRIKNPSVTNSPTTYYDKKLNGTYISFQYSGKYIEKNDGPGDNFLERHTLSADTHYDKRIQASVFSLPDSKLDSNGDYIYRMKSTSVYTNRKVSIHGAIVDIWVKNDGTEQTAFIAHGNKAASISFVTASASDNVTGEMDALLETLQWKQ
jgi:hypothetical protein